VASFCEAIAKQKIKRITTRSFTEGHAQKKKKNITNLDLRFRDLVNEI
jgi:hypothetical protein